MASKKQRRRQQKLKRHEYEEVYVDEEGRVLEPEEAEELVGSEKPARQSRAKAQPQQRGSGRVIEPPSLRRTAKRGLVFFPLMLVVIFLLPAKEDATTIGKVVNAVVLMGFFLPFSYVMDSMMYRAYQRRLAKGAEPKKS